MQALDDPYFPLEFQTHSSHNRQYLRVTNKSTDLLMASKMVHAHPQTHKITAAWPQ